MLKDFYKVCDPYGYTTGYYRDYQKALDSISDAERDYLRVVTIKFNDDDED